MQWLLRLTVRMAPETKTWLDIGAGGGLLVAEARALGLKAFGVEPSHSLVELAKRVNGVDILQGVFPHPALSGQTFDVISLVDVIEHVSDPVGLLKSVGSSLSEEGLILCVTPDVGSLLARLLGRRWWHFRLAHVGYFNRETLEMAAKEAGLDVKHWIRARWFFRVGYLADRIAEYVPIGPINRWAMKAPFLARIYRMVVPLDLKDSWVAVLGKPVPENKTP